MPSRPLLVESSAKGLPESDVSACGYPSPIGFPDRQMRILAWHQSKSVDSVPPPEQRVSAEKSAEMRAALPGGTPMLVAVRFTYPVEDVVKGVVCVRTRVK